MRNLINKRYVYQFFDYSMEIQIFSNSKFGQLRVALNENGETVFCLADVCKALGIVEPSRVKERLDSSNLHSVKVSTKAAADSQDGRVHSSECGGRREIYSG